ncbi:MAG: Response regulator [Panacagrimonas sp.]|nr:response regulator [Panacagrimonas sp.]MCC2658489.1 Response regulator [Panacagrimonas sp.]
MTTILIVDDEHDLSSALSAWLRDEGYSVETASDGRWAMERLLQGGIDVVLLDLMLPFMDGWALLSEIRGRPALEGVRVILMSAARRESALPAGMPASTEFLQKPFVLPDLLVLLRQLPARASMGEFDPQVCERILTSSAWNAAHPPGRTPFDATD